ncbi:MAG: beta-propeller domain-containing protein [Polyangiaceae bacterium]|nr:beta-propeller domain-containing protein [Polyangiaceae bacterium]
MSILKHMWRALGIGLLVAGCTVTTVKDDDDDSQAAAGADNGAAGATGSESSAGRAGSAGTTDSGSGEAGSAGKTHSEPSAGAAGRGDEAEPSGRPAGIGMSDAGAAGTANEQTQAVEDGLTEDMRAAAARAIQEADIIQVKDDTLYAMSRVAGLSVVDLSEPDEPTLLGAFRHTSVPFEMYLRGDVVIGIYRSALRRDDYGNQVGTVSEVMAFDVADPANIEQLGKTFEVPGDISDSRAIGDILYLVTYKQRDCYSCDNAEPETTVVSYDISDASAIDEIDRLSVPESEDSSWGVSRRAVMATEDRLYLAGVTSNAASTIDVVDVSDASGQVKLAGSVEVKGAVFSRWQMDERLNVLRVISQPPSWGTFAMPVVQTFTVKDCGEEDCDGNDDLEFEKLGELTMKITQQNEELRAVRFDDDKAYVITFEDKDPLFTIDLSDPENPKQTGDLEMDGWIYYMEPRGDRLLALGFDTENEDGSLFVSLIDVSDDVPSEIKREAFGGSYAQLGEDQDRVHKLFNVLDDLGLILVPFYGSYADSCGSFSGGIQLFEFTEDKLMKRGLAASDGQVRRAFIHNERLVSVSEQQVQTFNIDDLSEPTDPATLELINRVWRTVPVGDKVLRIQSNWWTRVPYVDLVPLEEAASPRAADGALNLYEAIVGKAEPESCYYYNDLPFKNAPAFVFDDHVAIVAQHANAGGRQVTSILVLDASGDAPKVAGRLVLEKQLNPVEIGSAVVQVGDKLVLQVAGTPNSSEEASTTQVLVDMSDPTEPKEEKSLEREEAWGTTGLHLDDNVLFSGYFTRGGGDNVNYFLDRVDAEDLTEAESPMKIPGLLVGPLGGERLLSVVFDWTETKLNSTDCYYQNGTMDESGTACWVPERRFELVDIAGDACVALDTADIDNSLRLAAVVRGDGIFFLPAITPNGYSSTGSARMLTVTPDEDQLRTGTANLLFPAVSPVAVGKTVYFLHGGELAKLDASDDVSPTRKKVEALNADQGYHLAMTDTIAVASLGDFGAQVIELEK